MLFLQRQDVVRIRSQSPGGSAPGVEDAPSHSSFARQVGQPGFRPRPASESLPLFPALGFSPLKWHLQSSRDSCKASAWSQHVSPGAEHRCPQTRALEGRLRAKQLPTGPRGPVARERQPQSWQPLPRRRLLPRWLISNCVSPPCENVSLTPENSTASFTLPQAPPAMLAAKTLPASDQGLT